MKRRERVGDLLLLATVVIWGNTFPLAKYLLTMVPPMAFAAIRYMLAACCVMLILHLREGIRIPARRDLPILMLLGFLGITVMQAFWTNALTLTSASKGAILVATSPIFANLIAMVRGQRLGSKAWAGILLSFAGVFLVINNSLTSFNIGSGRIAGDLMFLVCAFSWAFYSVLAPPHLARLGTLQVSAWSMAFGALMLAPIMLFDIQKLDPAAITLPVVAGFLYAAVLAGALGYIWWYEGVARLGIARSVIYSYLIPVFATLSAALTLGETISLAQGIGAAIVLTGLAITRHFTQTPAPDPAS